MYEPTQSGSLYSWTGKQAFPGLPPHSPRQVGRLHTGTELCCPRSRTEQVRCRKRGGRSCTRLSGPVGESPPRILKESSSGFTVSASDSEAESSPAGPRSGSRLSRYSTSSSGSLSVTTQQADVSPGGAGHVVNDRDLRQPLLPQPACPHTRFFACKLSL